MTPYISTTTTTTTTTTIVVVLVVIVSQINVLLCPVHKIRDTVSFVLQLCYI